MQVYIMKRIIQLHSTFYAWFMHLKPQEDLQGVPLLIMASWIHFSKMSSNINSFHKHDTKIRNFCLILICGGIMSWFIYEMGHSVVCIFIVIWSQIKSFYSSCYTTIQSICILVKNDAVNVVFNFRWIF